MLKHPSKVITLTVILLMSLVLLNPTKGHTQENKIPDLDILRKMTVDHPFTIDYSGEYFNQDVHFTNTGFYSTTNFSKAIFKRQVRFVNCYVKKVLDFSGSTFENTLDLSGTTFKTGVNFELAVLPKILLLSNLNLKDCKGNINLINAIPGKGECLIDLMRTDVSKVNLNYEHFRLFFDSYQAFKNGDSFDEERKKLYKDLLMHQKMRGYTRGYKKLLREAKLIYPKEAAQIANLVSDEIGASDTLKTNNPKVEEEYKPQGQSKEDRKLMDQNEEDIFQDILAAQRMRDKSKERRKRNRTSLIVFLLVLALAVVIAKYLNKKSQRSGQKVQYQSQVISNPPNYFKQKAVALHKAKKTVSMGETLWGKYERPEDVLKEPEVFWAKYEQLLEKAKG